MQLNLYSVSDEYIEYLINDVFYCNIMNKNQKYSLHILEKLKWFSSKEKLLLSTLKITLLKEWDTLTKSLLTTSIDNLSSSFLSLLMICFFLCSCFLIITTLIIFFSFIRIRKNFICFSNKLKLCRIFLFHFFSCILRKLIWMIFSC